MVRGVITHVSVGVQAPNFVEDILSRQFKHQRFAKRPPRSPHPQLDVLLALRKRIDGLRKEHQKLKFRQQARFGGSAEAQERLREEIQCVLLKLKGAETEFWDLNVPGDSDERQKLRQKDYLDYRASLGKGTTACSAPGPLSPFQLVLLSQV